MLTAQRPLVYAATDMVDAIDRQDDVAQFEQELQCVGRGAEVARLLDEQARARRDAPLRCPSRREGARAWGSPVWTAR
eukprot:290176-Prymnesium_polylepis.1